jgi:Spy/CpxP family protein refolding chaperone
MPDLHTLRRRALLASALLVLLAWQAAAAEAVKWWTAPDIQARLQLTPRQVAELNRIFDETLSERLASRERLVKLEAALSRLMARPDTREAEALKLVERVEALRARRNVSRTMMLVRMSRVLTPSQHAALYAATGRNQHPALPDRPARTTPKPQK